MEIILRAVKQGSGFKDTQKDVTDLGKAMGGLNKILGMAGLAIGAKELIDFGRASVDAAIESAQAEAALQAALISSGQATAEYKAQLIALATELENTTNFTDEEILSVQALLVGFQNIGQDVIPGATQAVANMAQMMGGTENAAKALGIALDAPGQAADRLRRQGILLTEQQQAQIDKMIGLGNIAGAQGIVLDAVNQKFGGQAEAARNAAGGMQDWAVATSRLHEEFGKLILALGESGVGGASVGLINTLTEGSTIWAANVEQIQLFADALNNLNEGAVQASNEVGLIQQIQKGWEIILLNTANAAIESTVGWDALAESYGEVEQAAIEAAAATEDAAAAAEDELAALGPLNSALIASGHSAREASYGEQALARGMLAAAAAAREKKQALEEGLATQREQANQGQLDLREKKETMPEVGVKLSESRKDAFEEMQRDFAASTKVMADNLGTTISGAISGAISSAVSSTVSGVDQDVIGNLMGLENAEANAGEAVRRMAAVAGGGIMDEWAPSLAAQLTGVQDKTAQAFVTAFSSGDDTALKAAAQQLALNPVVELFDAQMIANQVEQKLRTEGLQQALNDKVNAILGEKGLPAVQSVTQQVGDAVTTTGDAATTVGTDMAGVATSAETAMGQVTTSLNGTLLAIDTVILRIGQLNKALERTKVLAGEAGAAIGGLNPPAAPGATGGNGVPTQAQIKMGGYTVF